MAPHPGISDEAYRHIKAEIMYILGITSSYNHTWIPSRHKPQAL